MKHLKSIEQIFEDEGGSPVATAGMGAVTSSQPSSLAGATIGTNWSSTGGTEGSGDVSAPYINNNGGSKKVMQKIPAAMGKSHGARTGKKSREKKVDMKALRDAFLNRNRDGSVDSDAPVEKKAKVMNFDNFVKTDLNKVTKVKD